MSFLVKGHAWNDGRHEFTNHKYVQPVFELSGVRGLSGESSSLCPNSQ